MADTAKIIQDILDHAIFITDVPDKERTYEVYEAFAKARGMLEYVPWKYRTTKIGELAAKVDGYSIAFMREGFITERMCIDAIKETPLAWDYVPRRFRTKEFKLILSLINPDIIPYLARTPAVYRC
jgi:hypothetical protein